MPTTEPNVALKSAWTPRRIVAGTLVVALIVGAFFIAFTFRQVFACLLLGIVIDTALAPLTTRVARLGLARSTAIMLVYLGLGIAAVTAIALAAPPLIDQSDTLLERLPEAYTQVRSQLESIPSAAVGRLIEWTPAELPLDESSGAIAGISESMSAQSGLGVTIVRTLFWTGGVLLLAFNWSLQKDRTLGALLLLVSDARRGGVREIIAAFETRVGAFVRGQVLLCISVAVLSLVAYWLMGMPHALALAALAGLFELVPYVGPILSAVPALLVALAVDPSLVIWVLVAAVCVQLLENNLLVPTIMDNAVGVHSVVSLLALVAFTDLFGAIGMVLAVPLAAMVQVVFERWVFTPEPEAAKPVRRDLHGRALWELRELMQDVRTRLRHKDDAATNEADEVEDSIEAIASELEKQLAAADESAAAVPGQNAAQLEAAR
jgi:predicted PurR-regulated permease PerM